MLLYSNIPIPSSLIRFMPTLARKWWSKLAPVIPKSQHWEFLGIWSRLKEPLWGLIAGTGRGINIHMIFLGVGSEILGKQVDFLLAA